MARIKPFKAVRYNLDRIDDLGEVVAPPYDVINAAEKADLLARHPNNFVRLILGDTDDAHWHVGAADLYREWIEGGVLAPDESPSVYILDHRFAVGDGDIYIRRAIIAVVRIEDDESKTILGHERVFDGPITDRTELITNARANLSPIFACYSDEEESVARELARVCATTPTARFETEDGARHKLWQCSDPETCESVRNLFNDKTLFIADGHHRYATARAYRDKMRAADPNARPVGEEPYDYIMMALVALEDPGLVILPCHRILHDVPVSEHDEIVARLKQDFDVETLDGDAAMDTVSERMAEYNLPGQKCFALVLPGHAPYLLRTRDFAHLAEHEDVTEASPRHSLDVTLLHQVLLPEYLGVDSADAARRRTISYTQDANTAAAAVESGRAQAAILVNPASAEDVRNVALAGELMPQKTTYFHPKFSSGVVVYAHEQ
jgi:uncharacterized protein (DUF1015 family)